MIKNLLLEGFTLKEKKHYKKALEIFYKALEQDSSSTELMLEIADLYLKINEEERSLNYIEQVLEKNPKHIRALKLLKNIFIQKNALAEAERTAKNIYFISESVSDLVEIFKLLNLQGKYDEIFEFHTDKVNDEIILEQAKALYQKKEFSRAENLIQQALKNNSNNQNLWLMLGKIYYAQNNKDNCVEILDNLAKDNTNPEILSFYGLIESHLGNYKAAIKDLQEAIKLVPKNDEYYFSLANVYYIQGDILFAKKYYNMAISLNPGNKNYHFALANLYFSEKHYKRALEELQEDFFEGKVLKSIILYETGYLALAKKEINALLLIEPENKLLNEYKFKIDEELKLS